MSPLAATAAALFAVDPAGIGGVHLRARAGPEREAWLERLQGLLPPGTPWRRVPPRIQDDALLGGLDLSATLQAGRPVARPGLLAQVDGGVLLLPMAERVEGALAARLGAVLDTGLLSVAREAASAPVAARCGLVALDEGVDDDEAVPAALAERLGLHLTLGGTEATADAADTAPALRAEHVARAREQLPWVRCDEASVEALCAAALALGIASLRAPLQALRVARAAAALEGRDAVDPRDVALAARLVLAPRATRLPPADAEQAAAEPPPQERAPPPPPPSSADAPPSAPETQEADAPPPPPPDAQALTELVLAAARAAIPPGLLATLALRQAGPAPSAGGGAGAMRAGRQRGRAIGARRGSPRDGARLDIIETLRAAAPWQLLRAREWQAARPQVPPPRVHVRSGDFHVSRLRQRSPTTTVFVVDASGSAALHRLAEAKGAVELLLADCYVRRDRVALLSFRGDAAELLLPPTRSLARAKRSLAGLPGGGATPLAHGIDAARELAEQLHRRGDTPVLVLLTDGRGNVARDGTRGRAQAEVDALQAARALGVHGFAALLLDTSPQPQAAARALAEAMRGRYLPMPHGDAAGLSGAVRGATGG